MSQDNKTISEEKKNYATSFEYIETFCSNGDNLKGIEYLMTCMLYCYTYFCIQKLITEDDVAYYENRKQNVTSINFFSWLWQYIKDWFHNKLNKGQLDLSEPEVIKRRKLSNLKDECNKFIMPRLEQVKKYLDKNSE